MNSAVGDTGSKTGYEQVFACAKRFIVKLHHKTLSHQLINFWCITSMTLEKIKNSYRSFMVFCFHGVEMCKIEDKWFKYSFCFNTMKLLLHTNSSNILKIADCRKTKWNKSIINIYSYFRIGNTSSMKKKKASIKIKPAATSKQLLNSPAGIYLSTVNNRNTKTRCEICSKLTLKTPERRLASFWCLYC